MVKTSIAGLLLLLAFSTMAGERSYVTDRLEVPIRSGQSLQHKILKMLNAGTPVNLLQADDSSGYSLIQLDSGVQGWILSRYLTSQPAARVQVDETLRKNGELIEENKALKAELANLRGNQQNLDKSSQDAKDEATRLNTELIAIRQASANAIQIQAERDQLQESVIKLQRDLESLRREKQAGEADTKQNWFLIGAGVLFGGILLGILLPRLSWRKRSNWDSF